MVHYKIMWMFEKSCRDLDSWYPKDDLIFHKHTRYIITKFKEEY